MAVKRKPGKVDEEALDLPGVPDGTIIEDLPAMKVEDVRGHREHSSGRERRPRRFVGDRDRSGPRGLGQLQIQGGVRRRRDRCMRRERILPDEKALEKISRYETHQTRRLYHALQELQALQTRRLGGDAPLARLDVQGLPES